MDKIIADAIRKDKEIIEKNKNIDLDAGKQRIISDTIQRVKK